MSSPIELSRSTIGLTPGTYTEAFVNNSYSLAAAQSVILAVAAALRFS